MKGKPGGEPDGKLGEHFCTEGSCDTNDLASTVGRRIMAHAKLVSMAVRWLRRYRCGVVLSEQACVSGEMPDAIGWEKACHSGLVESKVSRADFLADRAKPFRQKAENGVGCERYYLAPRGLIRVQ